MSHCWCSWTKLAVGVTGDMEASWSAWLPCLLYFRIQTQSMIRSSWTQHFPYSLQSAQCDAPAFLHSLAAWTEDQYLYSLSSSGSWSLLGCSIASPHRFYCLAVVEQWQPGSQAALTHSTLERELGEAAIVRQASRGRASEASACLHFHASCEVECSEGKSYHWEYPS